ncbi:MAG: ABC transporter substrate-binding protein [Saprospiraceae bacterium]
MISAPSRRLQSNGSNQRQIAFVSILLLQFLLSACHSVSYPIQGEKKAPVKTAPNPKLPKVDTIQWTERKMDPQKSKASPLVRQVSKKSPTDPIFRIGILLPLSTTNLEDADEELLNNNQRAIQFYAGVKIALDSFKNSGAKLKVDVYDTQESDAAIAKILDKPGMKNLDMLIGPYVSENVQTVGKFAKENRIVLLSPWNTSPDLFTDNPYFIQMKAGLKAHCEVICTDIASKYKATQVNIIVRNPQKDKSKLDYLHENFQKLYGVKDAAKIKEVFVGETGESIRSALNSERMNSTDAMVFVVPHWSTETYVLFLLRTLNGARKQNPTVVYGFPQWKNFNTIDPDLFDKLQVQITNSNRTDQDPQNLLAFKRAFYQKYSAVPTDESIYGFDVMRYCMELIQKHKYQFPEHLDYISSATLDNVFGPRIVIGPNGTAKSPETAYYENHQINWLQFHKKNFVPRDSIE